MAVDDKNKVTPLLIVRQLRKAGEIPLVSSTRFSLGLVS